MCNIIIHCRFGAPVRLSSILIIIVVAFAGILVLVAGVTGYYWYKQHDTSLPPHRYRLTVEVDTPQGVRRGSSVIEVNVRVASQWEIPSPGALSFRTQGEAVAVDLPGGRTLFALLRSERSVDWAAGALFRVTPRIPYRPDQPLPPPWNDEFHQRYRMMLADRSLHVLVPNDPPVGSPITRIDYPMLVTFTDINDPRTVARVDPANLAASFGAGYRLNRITVQLTDDPVTTGIERRLGWLGEYPEPSLNPQHSLYDFSVSATVTHGDFRRGVSK